MRVLIVLTYYRPHYSGLTIYTERLARALAARGHDVTVLTSQFSRDLPRRERVDGVEVIRLPVLMRVSKGVIMPSMPLRAWGLVRDADVVNLHLPQLDAAPIALLSRLLGKPVVMTYHCDLLLPQGLIHRVANLVSNVANRITASAANLMVTNTQDYADHSDFLRKYRDKLRIIPTPVILPGISQTEAIAFREKHDILPDERVIGMVGRLAAEKGAEYLVQAMPRILKKYPRARVLHAGQYQDVMGEEAYARKLAPLIADLGERWKFLGIISEKEKAAFFEICDLIAAPSTNSTESFGMVQVEAMTCGTPAVTSDIPGPRQAVLQTGMGEIFPVGDAQALAEAVVAILNAPGRYRGDLAAIAERFAPDAIAAQYETLFTELVEP